MAPLILKTSLVILLLLSFNLHAGSCYKNGKIRVIKNNNKVVTLHNICVDHPKYQIISKVCLNKGCMAIKQYQKRSMYNQASPMGNPLYRKCRSKGGTPKMIEYFHNKWIETGICTFPDKSLISLFNKI